MTINTDFHPLKFRSQQQVRMAGRPSTTGCGPHQTRTTTAVQRGLQKVSTIDANLLKKIKSIKKNRLGMTAQAVIPALRIEVQG